MIIYVEQNDEGNFKNMGTITQVVYPFMYRYHLYVFLEA